MSSEPVLVHRRRQLGAGLCAVVFVALAALDWHQTTAARLDGQLTDELVARPTTLQFRLANAVTTAGSGGAVVLIAIVVAAVLWRYRRDHRGALTVLAAGMLGGAGELVAKQVVAHPRPVTAGLLGESGFGFPSGHTTGFTAVAVAIAVVAGASCSRPKRARVWTAAVTLSVAIALSRVVVGAHYMFDVVGGLAFGALLAILSNIVVSVLWLRATRLRPSSAPTPP